MIKAVITLILLVLYWLVFIFFPTPSDMVSGMFILGALMFPFALIFYISFFLLLAIGGNKLHKYLMETVDEVKDYYR